MVTGSLPFQSDTAMGVILQHLQTAPTPPHLIRPELGIPPALSDLLMKALEKDRDRRFASAQEMLAALEALPALASTPPPLPLAAPPPLPDTPRPAPTTAADIGEWPTLPRVPTPPLSPTPLSPAMEQAQRPRRRVPWWLWVGAFFVVIGLIDRIDNPRRQVDEADRRAESTAKEAASDADDRIEAAVEELLSSIPALGDDDIEVQVEGGRVTLGGEARNQVAVELAKALARTVAGVVEVATAVAVPPQPEEEPALRPPGPPPQSAPRGRTAPGVPILPRPPTSTMTAPAATAVRELMESAERALENGDARSAVEAYKAAMMLDPMNRDAQVGLARAVAVLARGGPGPNHPPHPSPPPPPER
jgi:BON domain-containing protein